MRFLSLLLLALLSAGRAAGQSPAKTTVCAPIGQLPYHPVVAGSKLHYQVVGGPAYTMAMATTPITVAGQAYLEQVVDYGTTQTTAYYRQAGQATVYRATLTAPETVEVPATPTVGTVWKEDSSWRYTVVSTAEAFVAPACTFTDCLHIRAEQLAADGTNKAVFEQFFQRGRGYVGTQMGGRVMTYLLPDSGH